MNQALEIIRLLGLPKAVRVKRRFDEALPHVRGYAVCSCLWAMIETGTLDRVLAAESVPVDELLAAGRLDRHVLESILSYLDGLSLVRYEGGRVRALPRLRRLMDEPRGFFELTYAYEPIFTRLRDLLSGKAHYPADTQRRGKYVGRGSGQLCRTLPYPVLADMLRRHGARRLLDLGCGDLALLFFACEAAPDLRAIGIDIDEPTVAYAREVLATSPHAGRIEVRHADMFDLGALAREATDVDAVTAVDTYHEYLAQGEEKIVGLLQRLRAEFPRALLYVGEFCKQPHEKLRRQPTAFLEHHLYHDLTNQVIVDAGRWHAMFAAAGLTIVEEKVFDMVGHGYFVLR
jgi:2-ketoarginine methyltransferase